MNSPVTTFYDVCRALWDGEVRRFLQVGANDGDINDPLRYSVIGSGWTGALCEPVPHVYERLVKNYEGFDDRLKLLNCAVAREAGTMKFFTCEDPQDFSLSRKSSSDRRHVERHLKRPDQKITEIEVPCRTVAEIVETEQLDPLDLLCVDAEGMDAEIVLSVDYVVTRPKFILVETRNLPKGHGKALFERLALLQYENYIRSSKDTMFVSREHVRRAAGFRTAKALFP